MLVLLVISNYNNADDADEERGAALHGAAARLVITNIINISIMITITFTTTASLIALLTVLQIS